MPPFSPRLILASASPRRRMLLEEAGYQFTIEPSSVDEEAVARENDPLRLPAMLADAKAADVAEKHRGEAVVVLAADTAVYTSHGEVLGKPADAEDARRMLRALMGTLHRVVTGIALVRCNDGRRKSDLVRSDVLMRPLSDEEIEAYIKGGAWQGKAGGYGIQDTPGQDIGARDPFIESITGELTNIVGLPMPQVIDVLEELGVGRAQGRMKDE